MVMVAMGGATVAFQGVYDFEDMPGHAARCDLVIVNLLDEERPASLVVYTERSDNPGHDINTCAEVLATRIVEEFDLKPEQTTFVARYLAESYDPPLPIEFARANYPSYTKQSFTWEGRRATRAIHQIAEPVIVRYLLNNGL